MHSTSTAPTSRSRVTSFVRHSLCVLIPFGLLPHADAAKEPSLITGQNQSYGYSWKQEMQLGAEADKELTESMGLYESPELQAYVERVGQRLIEHSEFNNPNAPRIYRDTKFTFRVIDSPVVNAFALPGGYVYVTRGLLSHLQNEAQLAVVLGHEIGHVAARHSSQQARRSQWGQLGVIAGAILGQKVLGERMPNIGETVLGLGSKAAEMLLMRYSREAEHESDNLGVTWATRAGYAASQSAHFFHTLQTLAADEGKSLPAWQSTHPDPGDRANRVIQIAQAANPQGGADNVGEMEYLKQIEGLIVGDDPRGGFAQNGVFYHPVLRFQLPIAAGWKLDNQRAAVVLAEPNGRAMMGLRVAPGSRARDAATQFTQQNKVQVTASGDTVVNGLPASVVVGQAASEKGSLGVWNAFIELEGRVYSLLGYAPAEAFEQMRPTFENVAAGFSPLRGEQMAGIQPVRLKIVQADRQDALAAFVPTSLPEEFTADKVARLNQMKLSDPVPAGKPLKVPDAPPRPNFTPTAPPPLAGSPGEQRGTAQPYPGQPGQYGYPQQASGYPTQIPPASYPQQSPQPAYPQNYPQPGYPSSQQGYPPPQNPTTSGQPAQPGAYPGSAYPSQNYPQPTYPQQTYPSSGYPPSNHPPQAGQTGYPPQGYPPQTPSSAQTTYPGTPPPAAPQFPLPGQRNPTSSNSSQPNWPR